MFPSPWRQVHIGCIWQPLCQPTCSHALVMPYPRLDKVGARCCRKLLLWSLAGVTAAMLFLGGTFKLSEAHSPPVAFDSGCAGFTEGSSCTQCIRQVVLPDSRFDVVLPAAGQCVTTVTHVSIHIRTATTVYQCTPEGRTLLNLLCWTGLWQECDFCSPKGDPSGAGACMSREQSCTAWLPSYAYSSGESYLVSSPCVQQSALMNLTQVIKVSGYPGSGANQAPSTYKTGLEKTFPCRLPIPLHILDHCWAASLPGSLCARGGPSALGGQC